MMFTKIEKFKEYEKDVNSNLGPYGPKVNPIYRNMLTMSTFDFSTELDVNISRPHISKIVLET